MKLTELQAKLGERMESLCNSELNQEDLAREIQRSKAVASLGREMVRNAHMIMDAKRAIGGIDGEFVERFI